MRMSGESLLIILLVGLIAGWLAGQIVQGTGFGVVGDVVIGVIHWRVAAASTRHSPWLRHCRGNSQRHDRRLDTPHNHQARSWRRPLELRMEWALGQSLVVIIVRGCTLSAPRP